MDELLKQALCSVGIAYLMIRFGRSIVSLVDGTTRRLGKAKAEHRDPDQQ